MVSEWDAIQNNSSPLTIARLSEEFADCGLNAGQTVIVHTSMKKLGWVCGGAETVIRALLERLGSSGTLVMPTHTTDNTDPSSWENPPIPQSWWQIVRQNQPAFNPAITPTRGLGVIPELFRTFPGARRSNHPILSFAALGSRAETIVADHALEEGLGDRSPLGQLYDLDGYILLLGVGHESNTSLHLAEYRARFPGKQYFQQGTAMLVNGARQWVEFETLELDAEDFERLGTAYEAEQHISPCRIGNAEVRLLKQRPLVDWAVQWIQEHRD